MLDRWNDAGNGSVHTKLLSHVSAIENTEASHYDRFVKLAYLYDPNGNNGGEYQSQTEQMSENVIAANVDTAVATITASTIRPRMLTDGADWNTKRTAEEMSRYAEHLTKLLSIPDVVANMLHTGALKGTSLGKVYRSEGRIRIDIIQPDDIVVDSGATRSGGTPREMFHRVLVDRDILAMTYPKHADAIRSAEGGSERFWADYRPLRDEDVVIVEGWRLPYGARGTKNYTPGRHVICVSGVDLLDEEWHRRDFPFAVFRWLPREGSYFGIGMGERVVGHQRELNRLNWTEGRVLQNWAAPTQWVEPADANIRVVSRGKYGRFGVYNGSRPPVTVASNPLSPQLLQRRQEVYQSSFRTNGVAEYASAATTPGSIESGIGLRELHEMSTIRYAPQEKGRERLFLCLVDLVLREARDMGTAAPSMPGRQGKKIQWRRVGDDDAKSWLVVASDLGRTAAGREQLVMEMAQGGVISQDITRRLLMPNSSLDIQAELSPYTQAIESVDAAIEEISDGGQVSPTPYQNAAMVVWRGQAAILRAELQHAPESVIENLTVWVDQAAWMVAQAQKAQMQQAPQDQTQLIAGAQQ